MTPFEQILEEIRSLHLEKQKGYGRNGEPFYNVKAGAEFLGIPWWQSAALRMSDKMGRLSAVANGSDLGSEGIEDAFFDLATYAIIGLVLFRESQAEEIAKSKASHPAFQNSVVYYWPNVGEFKWFRERDED